MSPKVLAVGLFALFAGVIVVGAVLLHQDAAPIPLTRRRR